MASIMSTNKQTNGPKPKIFFGSVCVCDCDCVCDCVCFHVYAQNWHMWNGKCQMSSVQCQMLSLILGTCWTTFVFMSMLKCGICQVSNVKCSSWSLGHAELLLFSCLCSKVAYVKCQMLMLILGACWTNFVFMSLVNCRCLSVKMAMLFGCPAAL